MLDDVRHLHDGVDGAILATMRRSPVPNGSRYVWAALVATTVGFSCAPARQASFATAEPPCQQNPAMCESMCRTSPGSGECSVATVHAAEVAAQGNPHHLNADALRAMHNQLAPICNDGIDRACAADQGLAPLIAQAAQDEQTTASAQASAAQPAQPEDVVSRADRLLADARAVLTFLGDDEGKCDPAVLGNRPYCTPAGRVAGDIIAAAKDVRTCVNNLVVTCGGGRGPACTAPCRDRLKAAEDQMAKLQRDIEEVKARRAEKQGVDDAVAACTADVASCQSECSGAPGSLKCVVLADMADTGDARLTKRRDPVKALDLARRGCCAGNTRACTFADSIQQKTTSLWTALQAVGDRLASNRYTLAMVLQLRPTPRNQRDVETARRLEPGIIAQEYCPARAALIEQVGLGEFQRRVAEHCKQTPPAAQGPTGAQVPLPQQCATIYAMQCPGTPPGPPTTRTTEVTCCANGLAAISQRMGCACGDVASGAQAPSPGPTCSTHDPKAEGSACIWTCR
jgi:hypothetical protein